MSTFFSPVIKVVGGFVAVSAYGEAKEYHAMNHYRHLSRMNEITFTARELLRQHATKLPSNTFEDTLDIINHLQNSNWHSSMLISQIQKNNALSHLNANLSERIDDMRKISDNN